MQQYSDVINDRSGNAQARVPVTVTTAGGAAATLYASDGTTPIANPLTTDANGTFAFCAADGKYDLNVGGARIKTVTLFDPAASGAAASLGYQASGTGAAVRTVQDKLRELPSFVDFGTQAGVQGSGLNWLFMPPGQSLTVAGALSKNYWGPGKIAFAGGDVPGTQGAAGYGFLAIETATPGTSQHFTFASKVFTGTRTDTTSAAGQTDCVALYGEAQRGAGSSDGVWAANTVTEVFNLNGASIGVEIDMNNWSGADPGLSDVYHALSLISGASGRGGTAIQIARNGDFPSNHWNRGLHIKDTLLRGIEFASCGAATGIWADALFQLKGTAAGAGAMKLVPYDDTAGTLFYFTDSADSVVKAQWLKRGEIGINNPANLGSAGLSIKGIANGDNLIFLQRNTDTSPSGTFMRFVNAGNSQVLFDLDMNVLASETNMKLSVAGTSAVRVSVGAADSAGTGYRVLRVPN